MTLDEFRQTLAAATPPNVSRLLQALWHDAKGDWDQAHRLAQEVSGGDGACVHATCTARKATSQTLATGIGRRDVPPRENRSKWNGRESWTSY
jgi:hypothetical protein